MAVASLIVVVAAMAGFGVGCGGQSSDEIARSVDDAIQATRTHVDEVPETKAESAAAQVACDALGAYSSQPAQSLSKYLKKYAREQRVLEAFGMNEVDPDTADRLAEAMEDIEDTQDAAEVADQVCKL
jgi:hypothetical protein